jgi:hypothetical protein
MLEEANMKPQFFNQLNLQNNSRTVAAGGPCNWDPDDDWAEIRQVTIRQGNAVGLSGNASTTVRKDKDDEWWLDASSSSQFDRGSAQPYAVAVVYRTNGTTYQYPWPDPSATPTPTVQLH